MIAPGDSENSFGPFPFPFLEFPPFEDRSALEKQGQSRIRGGNLDSLRDLKIDPGFRPPFTAFFLEDPDRTRGRFLDQER